MAIKTGGLSAFEFFFVCTLWERAPAGESRLQSGRGEQVLAGSSLKQNIIMTFLAFLSDHQRTVGVEEILADIVTACDVNN